MTVLTHLLWLIAAAPAANAATVYPIRVSAEAAAKLSRIDETLARVGAEVRFEREGEGFRIRVDEAAHGPDEVLEHEVLARPFRENEVLALRIYGGTPALRRGLYEAIGEFVETRDFTHPTRGTVDERQLLLDEKGIAFRCEATREAAPQHQCWTIVHARSLDLERLTPSK